MSNLDHTWQYKILATCMTTSATCSIIGSCIIFNVAFRRIKYFNTSFPVLQRLLIALALTDIIASTAYSMSPYLIPYRDGNVGRGNLTTCTLIGILSVFGSISAGFCNTFLSLYYFLTVRYGMKQDDFKRYEIGWYFVIVFYPLSLVVAGLILDNFGMLSYSQGCYLGGDYPPDCKEDPDPDACIRGGHETEYLSDFAALSIFVASMVGFVLTYFVWASYRAVVVKSRAYKISSRRSGTNEHLLREVTHQAIWFSLIYFNMFVWYILGLVVAYAGEEWPSTVNFILNVFSSTFFPLQGFLNCIVLLRPTYQQWKMVENQGGFTTRQILWKCIKAETPLNTNVTASQKPQQSTKVVTNFNHNYTNSNNYQASSSGAASNISGLDGGYGMGHTTTTNTYNNNNNSNNAYQPQHTNRLSSTAYPSSFYEASNNSSNKNMNFDDSFTNKNFDDSFSTSINNEKEENTENNQKTEETKQQQLQKLQMEVIVDEEAEDDDDNNDALEDNEESHHTDNDDDDH